MATTPSAPSAASPAPIIIEPAAPGPPTTTRVPTSADEMGVRDEFGRAHPRRGFRALDGVVGAAHRRHAQVGEGQTHTGSGENEPTTQTTGIHAAVTCCVAA